MAWFEHKEPSTVYFGWASAAGQTTDISVSCCHKPEPTKLGVEPGSATITTGQVVVPLRLRSRPLFGVRFLPHILFCRYNLLAEEGSKAQFKNSVFAKCGGKIKYKGPWLYICTYVHLLCFSTYNGQYGSTKFYRWSVYLQSFCKLKPAYNNYWLTCLVITWLS